MDIIFSFILFMIKTKLKNIFLYYESSILIDHDISVYLEVLIFECRHLNPSPPYPIPPAPRKAPPIQVVLVGTETKP